jgi:hypothetical protein
MLNFYKNVFDFIKYEPFVKWSSNNFTSSERNEIGLVVKNILIKISGNKRY